jgi:hypothetical protein
MNDGFVELCEQVREQIDVCESALRLDLNDIVEQAAYDAADPGYRHTESYQVHEAQRAARAVARWTKESCDHA